MRRSGRHQNAAGQVMALRQRPLHDDATHRVTDQHRRGGASFGGLEDIVHIIGDAEIVQAVAPFTPAMSAKRDRMSFVATRGEPRQELLGPDPGAAESAVDEQEGVGLAGPEGEWEMISRLCIELFTEGKVLGGQRSGWRAT